MIDITEKICKQFFTLFLAVSHWYRHKSNSGDPINQHEKNSYTDTSISIVFESSMISFVAPIN